MFKVSRYLHSNKMCLVVRIPPFIALEKVPFLSKPSHILCLCVYPKHSALSRTGGGGKPNGIWILMCKRKGVFLKNKNQDENNGENTLH